MAELRYLLGNNLVDRHIPTNLDPEPHPTFIEWPESQVSGEGHPLPSGFRRVVWNFEGQLISAEAWETFQDLLEGRNYGIVYIRTRTPDISDGQYEYKTYKAIMSRPIGTPAPGNRFTEVSLEFAIIEEEAVGYPYTSTTSTSTTTTTSTSTSTTFTLLSTSTTITTTSTSTTSTSTTTTSTSTTTTSTSTTTTSTSTTTTSTSTTTTSTSTTITSTTTTLFQYEVLELPYGCEYPVSMAVDEAYGFVYVGTLTSPGKVLCIRTSDFTVAKVVILTEGEDFLYAMTIDLIEGFLYVGTYTDPAKVVKLGLARPSLDQFTKIATITLD